MLTSLRASFGDDTGAAMKLRLDQVEEDPDQPRQAFDPEELEQLAASIRVVGVLQPIAVRPLAGDRYRLVYGARRLRAARLAERSHIPAYVVEEEQAGLTAQVIENQLRAGLNNSDLAEAIRRLSEGGMKVKEIAVVTGLPDWRLRHFRAVPTLPPFLLARLDQADMRALYELQGVWEKAKEPTREMLETAVGALPKDEMLTVTEARRIIGAVTGKPTHSIALERPPEAPTDTPPPSVADEPEPEPARAPPVSPSADKSRHPPASSPKPLTTPSNTKPGKRPEVVVAMADGKRGALVLDRKPSGSGLALVEVEGEVVELPCGDLRLVEVR
ncbi:ParB/RepB/Spo0J family partition protein [Falsiroseomonas tokyonensis]|uniref:ParB/RepB/Spo0J family partition protein n=1 Tax=Falsiroseomonas tokyonensis TaxID=430521 RepID=A0ABV7C5P3_9PROT|nr:ParB/RepB/Spo0J family partition protein [Falsiroseomonas tokyonensis]MBU8541747.1 ParB/RepB/Spo0J family partition protein [Falsiroseomonas tokyonensis]